MPDRIGTPAISYLYEPPGAKTAVIFIHGILGTPQVFMPMIAQMDREKYAVSALLLPGHGGTQSDFINSKMDEWDWAVKDNIIKMSKRYPKIILAGHSMGSLLALSNSVLFPCVNGVIAMATPMRVRIRPRALISGSSSDHREKTSPVWLSPRTVPRYHELYRLIRNTKTILNLVRAPLLAIHSLNDEVADVKGLTLFQKVQAKYDQLILSHSGHTDFSEQDIHKMALSFNRFIALYGA